MVQYSIEILGYTVALFCCYGVFVGAGFGRRTFSLLFLGLGIGAAMCVMLLGPTWSKVRQRVFSVGLFCAIGFAAGWGGYQALRWVGLLLGQVAGGVR